MGIKRRTRPRRRFSLQSYGEAVGQVLRAQANAAGVLRHSGNIGAAREFFIRDFLRLFLPRNVVVGSGEVIDADGRRSLQQDIVLYRASFPVIRSLGQADLFVADGVLATVEVKSFLSKATIDEAWKNTASVAELSFSPASDREVVSHGGEGLGSLGSNWGATVLDNAIGLDVVGDPLEAGPEDERIWRYVFAYDGAQSRTLNRHVRRLRAMKPSGEPDCVCVLDKSIGFSPGSPFFTSRDGTTPSAILHLEDDQRALGWLFGHLLWAVSPDASGRRLALRSYLDER